MIIDNVPEQVSEDNVIELANEFTEYLENSGNLFFQNYQSSGLTYEHLIAMFYVTRAMTGGMRLYNYCYDAAIECAKCNIKRRLTANEKIKVTFLPISAAEWPAEYIYRKLEADDRFEPQVVPVPLIGRTKEERGKTYSQTYDFFMAGGYNVKKIYDFQTEEIIGWEEIGGIPDVVINVTPWYSDIAKNYQITRLPLYVLNVYISYGLTVGNSQEGVYAEKFMYNKDFMNVMWKVYTETKKDYIGFQKYQTLKAKNVVNSGYIKMDYFLEKHDYSEERLRNIWSVPEGTDIYSYKKILITPHFSVGDDNVLSFPTFNKNMYFYIYLAKKYIDSVSFIFKPHPNLRNTLVLDGYMKSIEEYEAYLDEFNRLPNASVCEEADYLALFDTSDGIINDSISFVGEYMYVDKPMLFLERPEQRFNELGEVLIKAHYKVSGQDYMGIDNFVNEVVVKGNDYMRQEREKIFSEELDYYSDNGIKASEYVYRDIVDNLLKM